MPKGFSFCKRGRALSQNTHAMNLPILGGLDARAFLRRYWQKRPLFVRAALPGFRGVAGLRVLRALAARDDVESRMAVKARTGRKITQGPVDRERVFPTRDWTLLVSGVNLHVAAADRLLRRFAFLPQARLDDVMVSYAAPGGGVGPHVDSYDVFLLQGEGRRRWRVWKPEKTFHGEFICEEGDLLYLPPGWQHDGVALEPCYTCSIGFRAPRGAELAARFLDWLHERGLPDALYRDPGLTPARRAAAIPREMVRFTAAVLKDISWRDRDVKRFMGEYLTQPKPHVVFRSRPSRGTRMRLDEKSQLLYFRDKFFFNGDAVAIPLRAHAAMRELADQREIDATRLAAVAKLIGEWRRAGYVHLLNTRDG